MKTVISPRSPVTDTEERAFLLTHHICPVCKEKITDNDLQVGVFVCPNCDHHFRLSASERFQLLLDSGSKTELFPSVLSQNPIRFPGYEEKLRLATQKTDLEEAVSVCEGKIEGKSLVVVAMSFQFMGGSMGSVVGEKITRAILYAIEERIPCLICTASGGARMQEGIFSLLQMSKTSHAIAMLRAAKLPLFILLTDPTTGGVSASFAMLGDVILSEPNALIGFAGARVIEGTIKQKLPPRFQRAEFLLEHGFLDKIVSRKDLRSTLSLLLESHQKRSSRYVAASDTRSISGLLPLVPHQHRSAWECVQLARNLERPTSLQYIQMISDQFIELHGDRCYGDDAALVAGLCRISGLWFTVLGQQKGRSMKENMRRNYGMMHPEGYRKALRLARQAEQFDRPIITFVDTSGAFPGVAAEERGISESIANSILEFSRLRVPVITIIIGEGGSGGALGIAVADRLYMLENAVYSVISPEGFASLLLRDSSKVVEAADLMKMTADDLYSYGIVDGIIPEPPDGAHTDHSRMASLVKATILQTYSELSKKRTDQLLRERSERLFSVGKATITDNQNSWFSRIRKRITSSFS